MMATALLATAAALLCSSPPAYPSPVLGFLSRALGDSMVLQFDKAVVWGNTTANATVTTTIIANRSSAAASAPTVLHTIAAPDGIWRQHLPVLAASTTSHTLRFVSSSGEIASLQNVLLGQVVLCSGQSNMQFSLPITTNATAEIAAADNFPSIRLFTVGQYNLSHVPWQDLEAIEQPWTVASSRTVAGANASMPASPMGKGWNYFSSVCWLYGKRLSEQLQKQHGSVVPIGLISANYENTKIEWWADINSFAECGLRDRQSFLYNSMIAPLVLGPLGLSSIIWCEYTVALPKPRIHSCNACSSKELAVLHTMTYSQPRTQCVSDAVHAQIKGRPTRSTTPTHSAPPDGTM